MTTKHTLLSLCHTYDKIEIPIIQRDYAQGREQQEKLRDNFVNHLVESLLTQRLLNLILCMEMNEKILIKVINKQYELLFLLMDSNV